MQDADALEFAAVSYQLEKNCNGPRGESGRGCINIFRHR